MIFRRFAREETPAIASDSVESSCLEFCDGGKRQDSLQALFEHFVQAAVSRLATVSRPSRAKVSLTRSAASGDQPVGLLR